MSEFIKAIRTLGFWRTLYARFAYRHVMRLSHRFHWHYAPPIYPERDTQLWCQWCGMRYTLPDLERARASLASTAERE